MNALFTGNGPLRVAETGDHEDFDITYVPNDSWVGLGDLMWIDQPVGTGWSYGEHAAQSLDEIGNDFVTFMLNFYEEFPVYKTRDLVLTGESFAGKFLSYSTRAILEYNADNSNSFTFPIQSLTLYNPLVDTPTERLHQHELPFAIGLFDEFQIDQVEVLRRRCEEAVSRGWGPDDQAAACKNILNYATE
jgi:carboxypeptidase C (cathepsin A)